MRVAVPTDGPRLIEALDTVHAATPVAELIHADNCPLVNDWARLRGVAVTVCRVDWNYLLDEQEPDLVVALPGADRCIAQALRRGIAVLSVDP